VKLEFHPEALLEYEDAVSFYEDRQPGLGNRFILAVEHAFNTIRESPERWRFLEEDVRRRLTSVFPYAVLYTVEDTHVLFRQHRLQFGQELSVRPRTVVTFERKNPLIQRDGSATDG
jgi:toxin ParE1/3/4